MKAYLQTPCCGAMIIAEASSGETLPAALRDAMIAHYGDVAAEVIFSPLTTMDLWWAFVTKNEIGLLIEDGETIEEEYKRVMRCKNIIERTLIMVTFGMLMGMEAAFHRGNVPDPIVISTDPAGMMAFDSGFTLGEQQWMEDFPVVEETTPSPLLGDDQAIERRFLSLVPANDAVRH